MNNHSRHHEILLMLNARFFSRTWLKINETENNTNRSKKEQLKEACWNGLTPELLPECFERKYDQKIRLWEINDANSFIDLEFGEQMDKKEREFSVNPYAFMQVQGYN